MLARYKGGLGFSTDGDQIKIGDTETPHSKRKRLESSWKGELDVLRRKMSNIGLFNFKLSKFSVFQL